MVLGAYLDMAHAAIVGEGLGQKRLPGSGLLFLE